MESCWCKLPSRGLWTLMLVCHVWRILSSGCLSHGLPFSCSIPLPEESCWNSPLPASNLVTHIGRCQSQPSPMVHSVHHVGSFLLAGLHWLAYFTSLDVFFDVFHYARSVIHFWALSRVFSPLNGQYVGCSRIPASEMQVLLVCGLWRLTNLLLTAHPCSSRMGGCFPEHFYLHLAIPGILVEYLVSLHYFTHSL